ncbi:adenylate/guanylate cyclase domain-containing protein [Leptolyngbya sp. FACHB-1515]
MFQSESTADRNRLPDASQMGTTLQLSPGIAYYIRKLLRQNFDRLQFVVAVGAGLKADHLSDLNVVLRSLYCEETEVKSAILDLERLALSHQTLSAQGTLNQQAIASVEQEIFWLLGFKQQQPKHQGKIFVVDDTPENLRLISSALAKQGYDVRSAISGAMALSSVRSIMPDLILLDVRMPGLDGYEVCSQLKADALTQEIPVIFISAIDDVFDKVKAFKVGAVDFITKPFQIEEVCARVEHQLSIGRLRQRLEVQNLRLQREMQDRDRAQKAREQAESRYRSMIENAVVGIFQTSPQGRYLCANPALAQMYGYESPDELISQLNDVERQLYVEPERRSQFINAFRQQDFITDFHSQVYRKDNSIIWISEVVRAVRDENGILQHYEGIVKDITAAKHLEAERKQAEEARDRAEATLRQERQAAEQLLLKLLPRAIASFRCGSHQQAFSSLQTQPPRGEALASEFEQATVLQADIVNFSSFAAQTSATEAIERLNQIFSTFDRLVAARRLKTVKTMGDAYLVVGGVPTPREDHLQSIADLAIAMRQCAAEADFQLRVGIATGAVIAGVIRGQQSSDDLWGETVQTAKSLEVNAKPNQILVSEAAFEKLQDQYEFDRQLLKFQGQTLISFCLRAD